MIAEKKILKNKLILLGVTGGVAAYKAIDLIRKYKEEGAGVNVIMTAPAKNFVTPLSLKIASGNEVYDDIFQKPMVHIELTSSSDVMVIAPATANIIGKFAHGIADDLLSTCFLSFNKKVIIAPSMNWRMYNSPILRRNLDVLHSIGVIQVGPEKGRLACGEEGLGRMADVLEILEATKSALTKKDLSGEKILVTAGPTREYLDPIRFISNKSSGKMGYSIAKVALRRGADVTLISGSTYLTPPSGAKFIKVETAGEMLEAVKGEIEDKTVFIMSAAVMDFKPSEYSEEKIEKKEEYLIRFVNNLDIIKTIGDLKNKPFVIGFSAEVGKHVERAREKLRQKNADMIIFNDVTESGAGFESDTNKVIIIDRQKEIDLPLMSKESVAEYIFDRYKEIKA